MILLDANVVLEIIEKRTSMDACERLLNSTDEDKAISILTLDLVMYFAEKDKLALQPIVTFLESFAWVNATAADAHWAFAHFKGKDFEDGLQVAIALRENCTKFVTIDQGLAKKYAGELKIDLIR